MKSIGQVIQNLKIAKGWSNSELILNLGAKFSDSHLCQIIAGDKYPTPSFLKALSDESGCAISSLINMVIENKMTRYRRKIEVRYTAALSKYRKDKECPN